MVTVAWSRSPQVTPSDSKDELIVRVKFSFPSNILSSFIGILNITVVCPAGNMTVYGPES